MRYHAIMIGECNEEFGVDLEADSIDEAFDQLEADYPESRVEEVKSFAQIDSDQSDRYARLQAELDDDMGRGEYD